MTDRTDFIPADDFSLIPASPFTGSLFDRVQREGFKSTGRHPPDKSRFDFVLDQYGVDGFMAEEIIQGPERHRPRRFGFTEDGHG